MAGAADSDQARDGVRVLGQVADLKTEGELICEEALRELHVQGAGAQIVGGDAEDDALAGLQLVDDLVQIVLVLEDAALVLLGGIHGDLTHLHGAALAADAVLDVVIEEVDHLDLCAGLLAGEQGFLNENFAVAVVTAGDDAENFHLVLPSQK